MGESPTSLAIDRLLAWAAGIGLLVAAAIVLATLLTDRPVPAVGLLLIPGVPTLFAGQLWVIFLLNSRMPRPQGSWWTRWSAQVQVQRNPRMFLFGSLPTMYAYGLIAVVFLGWLAAMASFPGLVQGNPVDPMPGCPWPLMNHGFVTCVSYVRYEDAGAAGERFASGILMFFFGMHFGVAFDELVRRTGKSRYAARRLSLSHNMLRLWTRGDSNRQLQHGPESARRVIAAITRAIGPEAGRQSDLDSDCLRSSLHATRHDRLA